MAGEQQNNSTDEVEPEKLAAAHEQLAEAGASITEAAVRLRDAIEKGSVPPKTTAQLAARLEALAAQMQPKPAPPDAA